MNEWSLFAERNGVDLIKVIEAIKMRGTGSDRNVYFANIGALNELIASSHVFTDSILNVVNGFAFSYPLRPATGKAGDMNAPPLLVLFQSNFVFHIDFPLDSCGTVRSADQSSP